MHLEYGMGATAGLIHVMTGGLAPPVAVMQVLHDGSQIINPVLCQALDNNACQRVVLRVQVHHQFWYDSACSGSPY